MDRWFEFGCVRGIIGLLIGALQVIIATTVIFPTLQAGVQIFTLGCEVCGYKNPIIMENYIQPENASIILVGVIIGTLVAIVLSGFSYWFGARLLNYTKFKVEGMWKAIVSGVLGSIILGAIVIMILLAILPGIGKDLSALVGSFIIALPLYVVAEIGFAVITWKLYDYLKWAKPA